MNEDLRVFANITSGGYSSRKQYLVESVLVDQWGGLTEDTRKVFSEFDELIPLLSEYSALAYTSSILLEADVSTELNDKQIKQLFMVAAQAISYKKTQGTLKGYNPSMKTDDINAKKEGIIKKVKTKLAEIGKKLQDTKAVQGFDKKIDNLIQDTNTKLDNDSKIVKYTKAIGDYAKENPKTANFAIGVLTAAASFVGTPMAGMAVGMLLRTSVGLMKGEKASTAVGKAAMVAGIGALAGAAVNGLAELIADGIYPEISWNDNLIAENIRREEIIYSYNGKQWDFNFLVDESNIDAVKAAESLGNEISNMGAGGLGTEEHAQKVSEWLSALNEIQADTATQDAIIQNLQDVKDANIAQIAANMDAEDLAAEANENLTEIGKMLSAAAQGGAQTATDNTLSGDDGQ